jgi:hypothetical protein
LVCWRDWAAKSEMSLPASFISENVHLPRNCPRTLFQGQDRLLESLELNRHTHFFSIKSSEKT